MAAGEKKSVGVAYIITFVKDISLLTHYIAMYGNMLKEVEFKYNVREGNVDLSKVSDEEKQVIIGNVQMARYFVNRTYWSYKSAKKKIGLVEADEAKIERLHTSCNDDFIFQFTDAEEYAIEMNKIIVNDIIQDALESSQEFLASLYGEIVKDASEAVIGEAKAQNSGTP